MGIPGVYPPIAGKIGHYLKVPQGRTFLVHLLLYGMSGTIQSEATIYEGLMPPAADISDKSLADALNYVLRDLNAGEIPGDFRPISAAEFKAARGAHLTSTDVFRERKGLIAELAKTARGDSGG